MRHLIKGKKLGRTTSHRKATMQALSVALIKHERITTTLAKAKELRLHIEPVITRSKKDTTHNRRIAFSFLRDKSAVSKLFDEIGELVADRPGGYTRIIKIGKRAGDNADVAMIELVDYNDEAPEQTGKKKKRTRRAGRGKAADTAQKKKDDKDSKKSDEDSKKAETKTQAKEETKNESGSVEPKSEETKAAEATTDSTQEETPEVKKDTKAEDSSAGDNDPDQSKKDK